MREIIFRRCKLQIETNGDMRIFQDDDQIAELTNTNPDLVNKMVARCFIADCLDTDLTDARIQRNLEDGNLPDFGIWAELAHHWYDKLRDGWELWPHDRPVDARTVTGFIGSALRASNRDGEGDAGEHETVVGRGD